MVIYYNKFETTEIKIRTKDKIEPQQRRLTKGAFHLLELAGRTSQLASEIGFSQECLYR